MKEETGLIVLPDAIEALRNEIAQDETKARAAKNVVRLAGIYSRYLTTKWIKQQHKQRDVGPDTAQVIRILYDASIKYDFELSHITKHEQIFEKLRHYSGLTKIHEWLKKTKRSERIIQESNKASDFAELWQLKIGSQRKAFENFDTYVKAVKDLFAWFKIVNFFIATESIETKTKFMKVGKGLVKTWRKEQIMLNFLVSITLESQKTEYTLTELYRFLRAVDDYEAWKIQLEHKMKTGFDSNSGVQDLFEHEDMQNLILGFSQPRYRTLLGLSVVAPLLHEKERTILKDLETVADRAILHRARNINEKRGTPDVQQALTKRRVTHHFSSHRVSNAYDFLKGEMQYLEWLDTQEIVRVMSYADGEVFTKMSKYLSIGKEGKKYTVYEIFHELWRSKKPFGFDWNYIFKNRVAKVEIWADKTKKRFGDMLLNSMAYDLGHDALVEWMKKVEKDDRFDLELIPRYIAMAIYFAYDDPPRCIREKMASEEWYSYVGDDAFRAMFDAKVTHQIHVWTLEYQSMKSMRKK